MPELADVFASAVLGTRDPHELAERTALLRSRYRLPYAFRPEDPELIDLVGSIVRLAFGLEDVADAEALPLAAPSL